MAIIDEKNGILPRVSFVDEKKLVLVAGLLVDEGFEGFW